MYILKAEKRDPASKGKQLRRSGIIPAVLYGKHLDESVMIQIPAGDIDLFLRANSVGSRVELEIDGEKRQAMLKDMDRAPVTGKAQHLGFIELKKGEKVKSVATIILLGREMAQREGMVLQTLSEINYIALPSNLTDRIEVNIENMKINETLSLSDIDFANNPDIELITPADSVIVSVTPVRTQVEEEKTDSEETEEETTQETEETSE